MECIIPTRSIRTFAKLLACFNKIGDEIHLEPSEEGLTLRTINNARSAFAVVTLSRNFFDQYELLSENNHCKVQLKACMAVFKAVNSVDSCLIRLESGEGKTAESRLVFELNCRLGIKKVYRLAYEETEALHAVYSKETPSFFVCRPRVLMDIAHNFHTAVDEITFISAPSQIKFKSFNEDAKKAQEVLQTELTLNPADFEQYIVGTPDCNELTFCLKEFKAITNFADFTGQQLACYFDKGGRPLVFSLKIFNQLLADFVMATLVDSNAPVSTTSTPSATANTTPQRTPSPAPSSPSPSHSPMDIDDDRSTRRRPSSKRASPERGEEEEEEPQLDLKRRKSSRVLWSTSATTST